MQETTNKARSNYLVKVELQILHDSTCNIFKELKFPIDQGNSRENLLNGSCGSSKEARFLIEVGNWPDSSFIEMSSSFEESRYPMEVGNSPDNLLDDRYQVKMEFFLWIWKKKNQWNANVVTYIKDKVKRGENLVT